MFRVNQFKSAGFLIALLVITVMMLLMMSVFIVIEIFLRMFADKKTKQWRKFIPGLKIAPNFNPPENCLEFIDICKTGFEKETFELILNKEVSPKFYFSQVLDSVSEIGDIDEWVYNSLSGNKNNVQFLKCCRNDFS